MIIELSGCQICQNNLETIVNVITIEKNNEVTIVDIDLILYLLLFPSILEAFLSLTTAQ